MITYLCFLLVLGSTRTTTLPYLLPREAGDHPPLWWTLGAEVSLRLRDRTGALLPSQRKPTVNELQSPPRNTESSYTIRMVWGGSVLVEEVINSIPGFWLTQQLSLQLCEAPTVFHRNAVGIGNKSWYQSWKRDLRHFPFIKFAYLYVFVCKKKKIKAGFRKVLILYD